MTEWLKIIGFDSTVYAGEIDFPFSLTWCGWQIQEVQLNQFKLLYFYHHIRLSHTIGHAGYNDSSSNKTKISTLRLRWWPNSTRWRNFSLDRTNNIVNRHITHQNRRKTNQNKNIHTDEKKHSQHKEKRTRNSAQGPRRP